MTKELSRNEHLKDASDYLRGTLAEGLRDEITGAIVEDDQQLIKFHGMYLQDDRDLRAERGRKKLEKAFAFMLRVRISGGVLQPAQWLALDEVARTYANGAIRLTTRQTVQLHGVIKSNLKTTLGAIDRALLNTIAACGDVNRNVTCNVNPYQSRTHAAALELAHALSDHLLPRSGAYREIWLDGNRIVGGETDVVEPIYGKTYMPRKFKIAVAIPPSNDVDVFTNDLASSPLLGGDGAIEGWNVVAGGGMGMTHGETDTYPRTADTLGFCRTGDVLAIAEAVVTGQRDWGDRKNRKHARLKYTLEDRGLDVFRAEVETARRGCILEPARPFDFTSTGDRYGWVEGIDGAGHLTLFVQNGRVQGKQLAAMRTIAELNVGDIRISPNQKSDHRRNVRGPAGRDHPHCHEGRAAGAMVRSAPQLHRLRGAADMRPRAGGERTLSSGVARCTRRKPRGACLSGDDIVIRMTGCPNGCARPYVAEIGLVGKGPGRYNLYLGAAFDGSRLSKLYAQDLDHKGIVAALDPVFAAYANERAAGRTLWRIRHSRRFCCGDRQRP